MNKPFVNPVDSSNMLDDSRTVSSSTFIQIQDLLSYDEVDRVTNFIYSQDCIPVGLDGIKENYKEGDRIGSYRLSLYNEEMASNIWERIKNIVTAYNDNDWTPIGVNPLFRVIIYKEGGELIPHYDAPYISDKNTMTRKSMVIYLTDNTEGFTDFLLDDQNSVINKDYSDRPNYSGKVMSSFKPTAGSSLIFDHRLLHSVKALKNETKIIIRTDIVYKRY